MRVERHPAAPGQARLWFLQHLHPESNAYNSGVAYRVNGPVVPEALAAALDDLVARHPTLRTRLQMRGDALMQEVLPPGEVALAVREVSGQLTRVAVEEAAAPEIRRPFDLAVEPPLRAALVRGAAGAVLVAVVHHAAFDGWSRQVLRRDLEALYLGRLLGRPAALPELRATYAGHAAAQREWLATPAAGRQLQHWRERLAGAPLTLDLPTDRPRRAVQRFRGGRVPVVLPADVARAVSGWAGEAGATPFMVLAAAFAALLGRAGGQRELLLAVPVWGRDRPELEPLVGLFVNTVVLRCDLGADPTFAQLVGRVRAAALDAFAHAAAPFDRVVDALQPERDLGRSPVVQALFVVQPPAAVEPDPLLEEMWEVDAGTVAFDLACSLEETAGGIEGFLDYDADLFEARSIERLAGRYAALLERCVSAPGQRVWTVPPPERELALLGSWNDTASPVPPEPVHERILRRAAEAPDAVAVEWRGGAESYADLVRRSEALAGRLRAAGAGSGRLVGVFLERDPMLVAALLGVLLAGAGYVPLDPDLPPERLALMLEDASVAAVLTSSRLAARLPWVGAPLLLADAPGAGGALAAEEAIAGAVVHPEDLAYVIYTSGSTGRPKGVAVPHRALANFLHAMAGRPGMAAGDVVAALTSVSFDIAVLELFLPLLTGATIALYDRQVALDPALLARRLEEDGVTVLQATPITWQLLVDAGWRGAARLRALSGGEVLPDGLARAVRPMVEELWNLYGPTETAVYSSAARVAGDVVTIGRPIANTRAHVLDEHLTPVPAGVVGDLHLAGAGLARGYLGRPDLTAAAFLPDPFGRPGERMYRTGDRARHGPDGELRYLGRADRQVKVRGHRVELDEVEAVLDALPGVARSAVVVQGEAAAERRLVAFVVGGGGREVDEHGLARALRARLPGSMVPSRLVAVDALPLTSSGKVDRRALAARKPAPVARAGAGRARPAANAPRAGAERALADIWAELLGVEAVGRTDDFFELGGHSLLAAQLSVRVRRRFGVDLSLRELFEAPTLHEVADAIHRSSRLSRIPRLPPAARLPVLAAQENHLRTERWCARRGIARPAFNAGGAWRLHGPLDEDALAAALRDLARRHDALRVRFEEEAGGFVQVVDDRLTLALGRLDAGRGLEAAIEAEGLRPFDRLRGPLARAALARLGSAEAVLMLTIDHLISDAWSLGVLTEDLSALYAARSGGQAAGLPEPEITYGDYARWVTEWLDSGEGRRQRDHWIGRLRGLSPRAPVDFPFCPRGTRPAKAGGLSDIVPLPARLATPGGRVTPLVRFTAAVQLLLHAYTGQRTVAVTTPVLNRRRAETHRLVGYLANALTLRLDVDEAEPIRRVVERVRRAIADLADHGEYPAHELIRRLDPDAFGRPRLAASAVVQEHQAGVQLALRDLRVERIPLMARAPRHGLTFLLRLDRDVPDAAVGVEEGWLTPALLGRLGMDLGRAVAAVLTEPDMPARELWSGFELGHAARGG